MGLMSLFLILGNAGFLPSTVEKDATLRPLQNKTQKTWP